MQLNINAIIYESQTIVLNDDVTLCDCPGLVFPTVVGTQADMICDGLLPIDQMRDFTTPTQLVIYIDICVSHLLCTGLQSYAPDFVGRKVWCGVATSNAR